MNYLVVGLLAGLGALIRRNWTVFFKKKISLKYAFFATLIINILGTAMIIWLNLSLENAALLYLALTTGLLGGLTTFSTFNSELLNLWFSGRRKVAVGYFVLTYALGILVILLYLS